MRELLLARYVGEDGSLGFERGEVYEIETYITSKFLKPGGMLWVRARGTTMQCPYSKLETMLDNWEILERGN